jgi:hydroxymethylglutaryl-CoA lyase
MTLPSAVSLYEVGPREGFQLEPPTIATAAKLRLIAELAETGLRSMEVTSFVNPARVPQMADAAELAAGLPLRPGVAYTPLCLNRQGLDRAVLAPNLTVEGLLLFSASNAFSVRNLNRTTAEALTALPAWIGAYESHGIPVTDVGVMAAFGCNYEGRVPQQLVTGLLGQAMAAAEARGQHVGRIRLYDTMGWANPVQVREMVEAVRRRWPDLDLRLHFHDTRGTGMANVYAALEAGVTELETAIGGLGGCPFAGHQGAAGNVPTEDVAFLCAELGVATGLDLERLAACVATAEEIVGRTLPGKAGHATLRP